MKKAILLVIFFAGTQLLAQHAPKNKTLFGHKESSNGYGSLSATYSKFNDKDALLVGGYGGWLIDHKLMIGFGGYGLIPKHKGFGTNPETNKANELRMGYGGLMLEYTFSPHNMIHINANTLVGAGGISNGYKSLYEAWDSDGKWKSVNSSAFFVIQPSLNLEANITDNVRIAIGGGYRYIAGSRLKGMSNQKMSAPTANLSLKFGAF